MGFNRSGIILAGESNIGMNRRRNEDSFVLSAPADGEYALALVSDGIGGHSDGDLASAVCCRDVLTEFQRIPGREWNGELLRETLEKINRKLFDRNFREKRPSPMGCTVVAALFSAEEVIVAHAGDSRLYEFSEKESHSFLRRLTADHVPTPRQIEKLFAGQCRCGDRKKSACGIILRALGTKERARVEVQTIHRLPGASFLLCSDGFYRGISDSQIRAVLKQHLPPRESAALLMRQALLGKSMDNITLIIGAPAAEETHVTA